jgi:hypothetical protein
MKLSTAINKSNRVYVGVALGGGVQGSVKISKAEAKRLVAQWLTNEDYEGNQEWQDDDDYGLAIMLDGDLHIGN